ncbi:MAG TPA: DeoR/GlpR family DNA-binding transcription regulator [bacterium]|nr:DeoR/GlpR family DNA-binding transcription regulator [bacterium]
MIVGERRNRILEILQEKGAIEVTELAKFFNVTGATIRRDLEILERDGLLRRTHGGAVLPVSISYEPLYSSQKRKNLKEKMAIGKMAADLIYDGDTIFIESGTTNFQIAKNIKNRHNLTVVTNSIDIARELLDSSGIHIILTGGDLRKETVALIGPLAERTLRELRVDKVFLGISAIVPGKGMSTASTMEAQIKRLIIEMGREVIGLADYSKFGKEVFAFVAPTKVLNKLITDSGTSQEYINTLKEEGVEVIVCQV